MMLAPQKIGNWFGRFHVIAIHLPIGLVFFALMVTGYSIIIKKKAFSKTAYFTLLAGTFFSALAVILGWLAGWGLSYGDADFDRFLLIHRWIGTTALPFGLLTCYLGWKFRTTQEPRYWKFYLVSLLILNVLIALAGHFGGILVYGTDRFNWPS